ncbi:ATPase inhibitor, mitochondrial isoform X1 [Loxodonta africana]|uniref:ATPase inhibitor, mitochondrial n=1 Tax=Loxodonta africana TaxID=9785 RepID=G3SWQ8_LOXAF|nr:ATPase inhibitor, mitochondrial [Loxodonta africana]XP_049734411.1 ATPase inhibitor, mitochondrial [Elephas maximus indicus]
MATTALAARVRLCALGVRTVQAQGFSSDQPHDLDRGAGAIREAGGAFAKREAAEEERYFRAQAKEQLAALKKYHEEEITHTKKEIERLQNEIERHKQKIKKLKHDD